MNGILSSDKMRYPCELLTILPARTCEARRALAFRPFQLLMSPSSQSCHFADTIAELRCKTRGSCSLVSRLDVA